LDGGVAVPGIAELGLLPYATLPFNFAQNKCEGQDEVFWNHNRHSITVGISARRMQTNALGDIFAGGVFILDSYGFSDVGVTPSPGSFLSGQPVVFSGAGSGEADGARALREI
jgi:hypothetical protein